MYHELREEILQSYCSFKYVTEDKIWKPICEVGEGNLYNFFKNQNQNKINQFILSIPILGWNSYYSN